MDDTNLDRLLGHVFDGLSLEQSSTNIPNFLHKKFANASDLLRLDLDRALLRWMSKARAHEKAMSRQQTRPVYIWHVRDALVTAQRLDLPRINHHIRENIDLWMEWLSPLRIGPECDPALECWKLLTLRQPPDQSNIFEWLALAVDSRDEYLQVALTGIKRSPQPNKRATHITLAGALILHTLVNDTTLDSKFKFIQKHVDAMRAECTKEFLSSLPPNYWEKILSDAMFVLDGSKS